MYFLTKNMGRNFAESKTLLNIALPNMLIYSEYPIDSFNYRNKAGFPGLSYFRVDSVFGDIKGKLASFVIYIQQVFRSKMPNTTKNLTADACIASASTPTARKTVSVTSRLTKAELLQIIHGEPIHEPLSYDEFYRCAIATVSRWCVRVREGRFGSTSTDGIKNRLDTLCRIYLNR